MCIADNNIMSKVAEYIELKRMAEDLAAEIDHIADEIKAYMDAEDA